MDPRTWSSAVKDVGPSYAVIFSLIALIAFLAIKGVPAVVDLTLAINNNTLAVTASIANNTQNYADIMSGIRDLRESNTRLRTDVGRHDIEIDDLMADKKARDAKEKLRRIK